MEEVFSEKIKPNVKKIISLYCSKHGHFYPHKPSPNVFMHKLEIRMKQYYSHFSSLNLSKK